MKPDSNQLGSLYEKSKIHMFENLEDVSVGNLKFQPIIDQTGTFMYNAAKAISVYSSPLCKNEYSINDTQIFPSVLSSILLL